MLSWRSVGRTHIIRQDSANNGFGPVEDRGIAWFLQVWDSFLPFWWFPFSFDFLFLFYFIFLILVVLPESPIGANQPHLSQALPPPPLEREVTYVRCLLSIRSPAYHRHSHWNVGIWVFLMVIGSRRSFTLSRCVMNFVGGIPASFQLPRKPWFPALVNGCSYHTRWSVLPTAASLL